MSDPDTGDIVLGDEGAGPETPDEQSQPVDTDIPATVPDTEGDENDTSA
jgi:hypothetical protein